MKIGFAAGVFAGVTVCAACAVAHEALTTLPDRAPGSNEILKAKLESAEGVEVIISDVIIPANGAVPKHYHPGEEFLYLIEGTAIHVEEGQEDRVLKAGDAYLIRKGKVHSPRAGIEPARAVVFRVHVEGEPERILVE
jgi:quercetin dioxygenase-like cupin family protein